MSRTNARVLAVALALALLAPAVALPVLAEAEGAARAAHGHALVKKLPKRWLRAHGLKEAAAAPLADPDRDGACNWVEFRLRTDPRRPNAITTAPSTTTPAPSTRVLRLEGTVGQVTATAFTLTLEGGLTVQVALPAGAPVVDDEGAPITLSAGMEAKAFVSQAADLSMSAILVIAEGNQDGDDDGDDYGHRSGPSTPTPQVPAPGGGREGEGGGRGGDD